MDDFSFCAQLLVYLVVIYQNSTSNTGSLASRRTIIKEIFDESNRAKKYKGSRQLLQVLYLVFLSLLTFEIQANYEKSVNGQF
jgi:hypothetical protein